MLCSEQYFVNAFHWKRIAGRLMHVRKPTGQRRNLDCRGAFLPRDRLIGIRDLSNRGKTEGPLELP